MDFSSLDWSSVISALWAVVLALLALVVPVIKAGILEWLTNSQMGRVAGAAGRIAAEIALEVASSAAGRAAIDGMIADGAAKISNALPGAVRGLGATPEAIAGVVRGEVAKLLVAPPK